jgi:hypothetical protein
MSLTYLNTTTLSAAITASQRTISVASTANWTAGQFVAIGTELVLVQTVVNSTTAVVERGQGGNAGSAHASGMRCYGSSATAFTFPAPSTPGVGLVGTPPPSLPAYRLPLGYRAADENGNLFVLCDFTEPVHSGVTVAISNDGLFTAAVLTTTVQGAVGVVAEIDDPTSDQWGWVQVYGYTSAQLASDDSAVTSAYIAIAASSVTTPASGLSAIANTTSTAQPQIFGMFIVGAATTAVTSASSHVGVAVPVFLDFPYVRGFNTDTGTS